MHIFHNWRKDSKNARTCTRCGQHQYHSYGWKKVSCKVYAKMVLHDKGKDMQRLEGDRCEFCNESIGG